MALGTPGLLQTLVSAAESISSLQQDCGTRCGGCSVVHQLVPALSLVAMLLRAPVTLERKRDEKQRFWVRRVEQNQIMAQAGQDSEVLRVIQD